MLHTVLAFFSSAYRNHWENVPAEIPMVVMQNLSMFEALRASRTCKMFHQSLFFRCPVLADLICHPYATWRQLNAIVRELWEARLLHKVQSLIPKSILSDPPRYGATFFLRMPHLVEVVYLNPFEKRWFAVSKDGKIQEAMSIVRLNDMI